MTRIVTCDGNHTWGKCDRDNCDFPWPPGSEPITFEEHFGALFADCLDVMVERQRKYGPHNIPKFGTFGTLVRMGDKYERLVNLHQHADATSDVNETIEDTLIDLANYATIMRAQLRGIWTADRCPPLMNYQEEPDGE